MGGASEGVADRPRLPRDAAAGEAGGEAAADRVSSPPLPFRREWPLLVPFVGGGVVAAAVASGGGGVDCTQRFLVGGGVRGGGERAACLSRIFLA